MAKNILHTRISLPELAISSVLLLGPFFYGLVDVYKLSSVLRNYPIVGQFARGRLIFEKRDGGDREMVIHESTLLISAAFLISNAFTTWLLIWSNNLRFRLWTALLFGFIQIFTITGPENAAIILLTLLVSYVCMRFTHPLAASWISSFGMIFGPMTMLIGPWDSQWPKLVHPFSFHCAYWHMGWNVMRLVSFGSEWTWHCQKQSDGSKDKKDGADDNSMEFSIFHFIAYVLYVPTAFGPIISYPDFYKQVISGHPKSEDPSKPFHDKPTFQIRTFLQKLLLITGWWFIVALISEFFFIHIIGSDLSLAKQLNGFGVVSFLWLHGQYFQAKYMIIYGIPWLAAYLDGGVRLLPLPICISRVYLYSQMWKHFDTGLYDFMKRYIYIPLGGSANDVFASMISFVFIFVWHGLTMSVWLWSMLNYFQVVIEIFLRKWAGDPNSLLSVHVGSRLSPLAWRRVKAVAGAASFVFSCGAIAFFLLREPVGPYIAKRAVFNFNNNPWVFWLVSYGWVQMVFSWENWNAGFQL